MKKIGIHFELNTDWVGGSYYIRNLIAAMALLPEEEQAFVYLISSQPDSIRFIQETGYKRLGWVHESQYQAKKLSLPFDALFPHPTPGHEMRTVSWIPDFQELHLSYFFSEDELKARQGHHRGRFATAGLVVSSEDVRKDVEAFYPGECENISVVRFASFDRHDENAVESTRVKYELPERYVMCANQVWLHKNHIVALRAVALLKQRGTTVHIVFTGNENDYRVAGYSDYLKQQAVEWGIADNVHFLGFIPRTDQLCLMNGAHYVVQPSLFEGWSTVIEDAKSMGKFVVASDLGVHKEQLTECCRFFFRHDPVALADIMGELDGYDDLPTRETDYNEARRGFARDFMHAIETFLPEGQTGGTGELISDEALAKLSDENMASLLSSTEETGDKPAPVPAPAPAPAPTAANTAGVQDILLANRFTVAMDNNDKAPHKILMIHPKSPVELSKRYEKLLVKVVYSNGHYFVELRSSSISPNFLEGLKKVEKNGDISILRITTAVDPKDKSYVGLNSELSSEILADINFALRTGTNKLQALYSQNTALVPEYWRPLLAGISIRHKK